MRRLLRATGAAFLCLFSGSVSGWAQHDSSALSRALAAAEERVGPAHPDLLAILAPLAELRFRDADITRATEMRRRSLRIAVDAFGSSSVPAAEAMVALASLYIELRRYLDAEPLLIAARAALTGPASAPVLSRLARVALARGDKDCARSWAEQALAIDEGNQASARSERLRTLGAVFAAEEQFEQSERILRQALAIDREDKDELAAARSLSGLAHAYLRQKRYAGALPLVQEAMLLPQAQLAATHPLLAEDLHDLGLVYLETKRTADAQKAFRAAINLLDRGAGRETPQVAYIELDLARAAHEQGREEEAASLFADARRILNIAEDEERERERQI